MTNKTLGLSITGALAFVTFFSGAILSTPTASAEVVSGLRTLGTSVVVSDTCSMTANTITAHSANIMNGIRLENIGDTKIDIFCNDPSGFALYAAGYSDDTYGNTDLIFIENPGTESPIEHTIATGLADATVSGESSWGMKIYLDENSPYPGQIVIPASVSSTGYYAVPEEYTKVAYYGSATGTTASDGVTLHTTYAAFIKPAQAAGVYDGAVRYILVHPNSSVAPSDPTAFDSAFIQEGVSEKQAVEEPDGTTGYYYRMQDMTNAVCENMQIGLSGQLVDTRDNNLYWILKAKDGHCWMTQNLDLNLDQSIALNSNNTDLNEYGVNGYTTETGYTLTNNLIEWTPVRSTIATASISGGTISGWGNSQVSPYSADPGDWFWTSTWYASSECGTESPWCNYLNGNAKGKFNQTAYAGNGKHGHVGNYYNWTAAIATNNSTVYDTDTYNADDVSGNPKNSICPKGWRLPTISSKSAYNEFANLSSKYPNASGGDRGITLASLFFVRGGLVYSSTLYNAG